MATKRCASRTQLQAYSPYSIGQATVPGQTTRYSCSGWPLTGQRRHQTAQLVGTIPRVLQQLWRELEMMSLCWDTELEQIQWGTVSRDGGIFPIPWVEQTWPWRCSKNPAGMCLFILLYQSFSRITKSSLLLLFIIRYCLQVNHMNVVFCFKTLIYYLLGKEQ